ncbi:MAG: helix-turn-helix domain-containing protein [Nocardioidaceae bacterium]|nr:MAG: helix-turn-helix domain-containing protein [Nocardioidaceae bacterium]
MSDSIHPVTGLEPVLTTSELAAHLGVPVQTIHDLRHSGRGPRGFRVGRELRYRLSSIQTWLTQLEESDPSDHDEASAPPVEIVGRGA